MPKDKKAPAKREAPRKWWVFTDFKLDDLEIYQDADLIQYCIIGDEICPKTGRRHGQGYIQLKKKKRREWLKENLFPDVWFEAARADDVVNRGYCSKGKNILLEFGKRIKTGQRTDLDAVKERIDAGATELEIATEFFSTWCQHRRAFREYRILLFKNKVRESPHITILWGDSGAGKSTKALEMAPNAYWMPQGKWFDGYDLEDTVIIDEFYGWFPYSILLRLLDRFPLLVETKGGTLPMRATKFIFTSNKPVEDWYPNMDIRSLQRRIEDYGTVKHMLKTPQWFQGSEV